MDSGWALILSAVVTAVGGIIVSVISKFRKENKQDHDVVLGLLRMVYKRTTRVEEKVDRVDSRLSSHLESHLHGGADQV